MYIGVDYYPEHWPRSRWKTDARLMQEAGFNVVRLFEFNWVNMEPREGRYQFASLDEPISILADHGMSVILGTPTAVMPAWAARAYPETVFVNVQDKRGVWGVRRNNCFTSPKFRSLSQGITRAMADHFAQTPNVIGWQTDNELGNPVCYCGLCRADFLEWLRRTYDSLDKLNAAWGTHFWGHRFGDWDEITIPVDPGSFNPGACLDWQRYFTYQNIRFQREQITIIRERCPHHFITHNLMGLFAEIDYFEFAKDLDFVSWDNYPTWDAPSVRFSASMAADLMRGLKKKNFWIMEQTAGPCGWGTFGRNLWPGELRNVAYQQLAHGADAQIWFRWRTCTAGREQYWHGLLGHDAVPGRRYREAAQTAREYRALAAELQGTTPKPQVAIVYDYDSLWALRFQPGFRHNDYTKNVERYYDALTRAGVNVDFVNPQEDVSPYRLVVAPQLHVLPDTVADRIVAYVKNGGVVLTDFRTAVKNETNLCRDRTLPGRLSEALGIIINEYESLESCPVTALKAEYTASGYADWITPAGATVEGAYDHWHLASFAVLTRHAFGKGVGWYLGAPISEPSFYDALIDRLLHDAAVTAAIKPPSGVEVSVREGEGRRLAFIINHDPEPKTVAVPGGCTELLSGEQTRGAIGLDRFGVAIVKLL